jgi:hypothetical protein
LLHVFLLPLNIVRLREMTHLINQVETAASGDLKYGVGSSRLRRRGE